MVNLQSNLSIYGKYFTKLGSRNHDIFVSFHHLPFREIGWEGVDWMHLAQDRDQWWALVNMIMNLWVP
jgi:hypothetical protein